MENNKKWVGTQLNNDGSYSDRFETLDNNTKSITPQEKANELVKKFYNTKKRPLISFWKDISNAKQCALIVADECYKEAYKQGNEIAIIRQSYWEEVKSAIEAIQP